MFENLIEHRSTYYRLIATFDSRYLLVNLPQHFLYYSGLSQPYVSVWERRFSSKNCTYDFVIDAPR